MLGAQDGPSSSPTSHPPLVLIPHSLTSYYAHYYLLRSTTYYALLLTAHCRLATAQDAQLQLFASLIIFNLLHVDDTAGGRQVVERQRAELLLEMQRAYHNATELQVELT